MMSRGHLYWILSNPIYVGRLRHKGQIHDGLHSAIIDPETWDRVRQKLESQTRARRISQPDDHSFLAGKLYDDRGNRMSASHASKGGRRWRYYVSRAALTGRKQDAGSVVRIPASEIENRITRAVGTYLAVNKLAARIRRAARQTTRAARIAGKPVLRLADAKIRPTVTGR